MENENEDPRALSVPSPRGGQSHPWFAVQRHVKFSRKIMSLPGDKLRSWLILMASTDNDGYLPRDLDDLKWQGIPPCVTFEELVADVHYLIDAGCIDAQEDGSMQMHDWDDHQPAGKPKSSSDRAKAGNRRRVQA